MMGLTPRMANESIVIFLNKNESAVGTVRGQSSVYEEKPLNSGVLANLER